MANERLVNTICRGDYNHGGLALGGTSVDPHTLIYDATTLLVDFVQPSPMRVARYQQLSGISFGRPWGACARYS